MSASAPTSGRWQRVEEIYHAALEHDIDTRIAFIQRECQGDTELEREVETLLATEGKGGVLDHPAIEFAPELLAEEAPLRRGTELGPFRIEGSVGSGGMGRV